MTTEFSSTEILLASAPSSGATTPFFTIAIPHYKHPYHLQQVLATVFAQTTDDFEILVSDDCSPDASNEVIPDVLRRSGRAFRYYAQPLNLGYDRNVRFCLREARGRYVFLLGNDDCLANSQVIATVGSELERLSMPEVAVINYEDWATGEVTRRAQVTRLLPGGPETAIRFFRSLSFVSGLIFKREAAVLHETARWDHSIYYQIYLGSRILATGGSFGLINVNGVRKDVRINGSTVENYITKFQRSARSFEPRDTGLESVIRVSVDAIVPFVPAQLRSRTVRRLIQQVLLITYPFWLFEYRRIARWSFAVGVARSLWPGRWIREYDLAPRDKIYVWVLYSLVSAAGLSFPATPFNRVRSRLRDLLSGLQQAPGRSSC